MATIDPSKTIFTSILQILIKNFERSIDFNNAVLSLCRTYNEDKIADSIYRLYEGKLVLGHKDIKGVYNRYKDFIMYIEASVGIYRYFYKVFQEGMLEESYETFYLYLLDNRRNIGKIEELVEKIVDLGINKVSLDDTLDYEDVRICTTTPDGNRCHFVYGENPNVIASIGDNTILYKLLDTNYLIPLERKEEKIKNSYDSTIVVSSLLFDKNLLPKKLDEHNTLSKIIQAKTANTISINKSINNPEVLKDALVDLNNQYKTLQAELFERNKIDPEYESLVDKLRRLSETIEYLKYEKSLQEREQTAEDNTSTGYGKQRTTISKNVYTQK
jgi:hypothetical protein